MQMSVDELKQVIEMFLTQHKTTQHKTQQEYKENKEKDKHNYISWSKGSWYEFKLYAKKFGIDVGAEDEEELRKYIERRLPRGFSPEYMEKNPRYYQRIIDEVIRQ